MEARKTIHHGVGLWTFCYLGRTGRVSAMLSRRASGRGGIRFTVERGLLTIRHAFLRSATPQLRRRVGCTRAHTRGSPVTSCGTVWLVHDGDALDGLCAGRRTARRRPRLIHDPDAGWVWSTPSAISVPMVRPFGRTRACTARRQRGYVSSSTASRSRSLRGECA